MTTRKTAPKTRNPERPFLLKKEIGTAVTLAPTTIERLAHFLLGHIDEAHLHRVALVEREQGILGRVLAVEQLARNAADS